MKPPFTTALAGLPVARAQNQTIATWFSTSTASLASVSNLEGGSVREHPGYSDPNNLDWPWR